jgi:tRNA-splicing ligase RtcB
MYKFKEDKMKVPCYVWSKKGSMEQNTIDQIKNASSLPFAFHHTVLCPDGHLGYGAPIGGILATEDIIIVNFVGVDIGCGCCAVKTSLTEIDTETLKKIMGEIRKVIPVGFNKHKEYQGEYLLPESKDKLEKENYPIIDREYSNALKSLGTLGGGNHFIEIQKGDDGHIWIMIHSGSRNLGLKVANHYNKLAIELNEKWHSSIPKEWELAFLPVNSEEGQAYIREMNYCVDYALANRKLMMNRIISIFKEEIPTHPTIDGGLIGFSTQDIKSIEFEPIINIAHNYASQENHFKENVWVHRKGATQARKGQIGIIPGSQGTASYIVEGLGNPESFESCSHGAGRVMGRKQAEKTLDLKKEIKILDDQVIIHGIRNKSDLDEATSCYKSIEEVMENQKDLVKIKVKLSPLAVIKG